MKGRVREWLSLRLAVTHTLFHVPNALGITITNPSLNADSVVHQRDNNSLSVCLVM